MKTIEIIKDTADNQYKARVKGQQALILGQNDQVASFGHLETAVETVNRRTKEAGLVVKIDYVGEETWNARKKEWVAA